jgi:PAS domain S-box-containing protein
VESLGEGIAILAADGAAIYCNSRLSSMLGAPVEALLGMRLASCIAPESVAAYRSLLADPSDAGESRELGIATPGGESRVALVSSRPVRLGTFRGTGLAFTDIGETKRLETRGFRLSKLYATLSAFNQAIVHTVDRDSLFYDCCRAASELGGFRLAWIGLIDPVTRLVSVSTAYGETGYLEGIRISAKEEPEGLGPTGIAVREGTYFVCNDFLGSEITRPWHQRARAHGIRASASIVLRQGGEAIGSLTLYSGEKDFFDAEHVDLLREMGDDLSLGLDLLKDRELRKEAERALRLEANAHEATMKELRDKEQALIDQGRQAAMGAMVGNIAHQWRQPLNSLAITIQKQLLYFDLGKFDRPTLERGIGESMRLIDHMSQTIDDFRDFFKPNREKVRFSARDSIAKTLSLLGGAFEAQKIEVELDARDDAVLNGYPNEFSQALINIIINAKDALLERKVADPRISLSLGKTGGKIVIVVADNAGGIPEDILDKIFTPYFSTKADGSGTGLGLSMSKTIVEKSMGGRLSVRNASGGAEFRIEV